MSEEPSNVSKSGLKSLEQSATPEQEPDQFLDVGHLEEAEMEASIEALALPAEKYEEIDREFQNVLEDLSTDPALTRFRNEFQRFHKLLKTSYESEKKMVKRCKEFSSEILNNATKVQIALKHAHDDQETIHQLKRDIETAWQMVDQAKEREEMKKSQYNQLKNEIVQLQKIIESDVGYSITLDKLLRETQLNKEEAVKEKEDQINALLRLRAKTSSQIEDLKKLELKRDMVNEEISNLQKQISKAKADYDQEEKRRKATEQDLVKIKEQIEQAYKEGEEKKKILDDLKIEATDWQQNVEKLEGKKKTLVAEINQKAYENDQIARILAQQVENNRLVVEKVDNSEHELKKLQQELQMVKSETQQLAKETQVLKKKNLLLLAERNESELLKEQTKTQLQITTKDMEDLKRFTDGGRKDIDKMHRDQELLVKQVIKADEKARENLEVIQKRSNEEKKLTNEINGCKTQAQRMAKIIYNLEREKERYAHEASVANTKYLQCLEELKLKNATIAELQKRKIEADAKLKQQQNLYDAIQNDRNLYAKNSQEYLKEIDDMRTKFKIYLHQIDQLKEEITSKNNQLKDKKIENDQLERQNEKQRAKQEKNKEKLDILEEGIKNQENEIGKFKYIIAEAENERVKQKKELEMVLNDRDILGMQLIKRNEDLSSLYEKIKIQHSTLAKGEASYQERMEDIKNITQRIMDLRREIVLAKSQVSCIPGLQKEVYRYQKLLTRAQVRVTSLREELKHPMNVHRYRKLQGTEPETYENIQKIQILQRRLIAKTEEVEEKDALIQEKERLYVELKNILARQPGEEVASQLQQYQANLKEKARQMKAMASELQMYQAQVQQYKFEIQRIDKEMQNLNQRYFQAKKLEAIGGMKSKNEEEVQQ